MEFDIMLILQLCLILALFILVFYIVKFYLSLKLAKRISIYSIDPLRNDQVSLFDAIYDIYKHIVNTLSKSLNKIKIIERYSHQYDKYVDYLDKKKAIDYVSNKVLSAILFLIINIVANIAMLDYPSIIEIILTIAIGYCVPDMYNRYQRYLRHKKIERDLLNAIVILNNAFKSGRSTMQAIEIVKDELDGPIKVEFEKMHTEIAYGLSLESVFKRFSKRVKIEEISYVASSLTILNKTGGNIVKVFTSIENSLFNKRRLESEMKALTSSSKVMSRILLALPFIFTIIILLLSPDYFNPLFNNFIGLTVLLIMILFYGLYVFFVAKIMRVRL